MRRPQKAFYDQAARRQSLIYRVCAHRREDDCKECPAREVIDGEYYQPACYALAEELIAVILEDDEARSKLQIV